MRAIAAVLAALLMTAACTIPAPTQTSEPTATATPDIGRAKLDIAYTALVSTSYQKPTSRELLYAALEALHAEVRAIGGRDVQVSPTFSDETEMVLADFRAFAEAVSAIAAENPQLSADRITDVAVRAMVAVKPDCHTYVFRGSSAVPREVSALPPPAPAAPQQGPTLRMLGGGIAHIAWQEFTFDIADLLMARMDEALAQGARAWLFDLRGNRGGYESMFIAQWFLDGGPMLKVLDRTDNPSVHEAKVELRLPEPYQLPIAIVLDGRAGSAPEVLALALREHGRATIFGTRSHGCTGSTQIFPLPGGQQLAVQQTEIVGGVTGLRVNGIGLAPDVEALGEEGVRLAAEHLRRQVEGN